MNHCRTRRGNWTPPKAKIGGRTTGEKLAKKAEYIGMTAFEFVDSHTTIAMTLKPVRRLSGDEALPPTSLILSVCRHESMLFWGA